MSDKRAPEGQKIRKIIGGADSVCVQAPLDALRAVRAKLIEEFPEELQVFDELVLGTMHDHLRRRCDMDTPSIKKHWAKMQRFYKETWEPIVEEVVTIDPSEDFDQWLATADTTTHAAPMDPFKAEGVKLVKEYARRGEEGAVHFVRKVVIGGKAYLAVGSSNEDDEDGDVIHVNGAIGGTSFRSCSSTQVVQDGGETFKVYCKEYERKYWIQFLILVPGRKFRLWKSVKNSNDQKHTPYLVMEDSDHGFGMDPVRAEAAAKRKLKSV